MNIYSLSKSAIRSMTANKVRTALTALGMVIGITAIMIVFSAGEGLQKLLNSQIESFGSNLINIEIKAPTNKSKGNSDIEGGMSLAMGTQITTLTLKDLEDIKKIPNIENGYGAIIGQELATRDSYRKKVTLMGVSPSYIKIDRSEIEEGRFFDENEDKTLAKVAVIGSKIKQDLFGDQNPIGQEIRLGRNKFEVIGTVKKRGASLGMDLDSYVYLPVRTVQKKILGIDHLIYIITTFKDELRQEETAEEIRNLLRRNHDITPEIDAKSGKALFNKDDFRVTTMEEMLSILGTVSNATTYLLLGIIAISLLVGGVGVMNIMYVIVSERTREIGLRKAVGARLNDILGQFLLESIFVTVFASAIGMLLGTALAYLVALIAQNQGLEWGFVMPAKAYLTAISFSLLFGVFFGLFPARKAAKMDPISALRNE